MKRLKITWTEEAIHPGWSIRKLRNRDSNSEHLESLLESLTKLFKIRPLWHQWVLRTPFLRTWVKNQSLRDVREGSRRSSIWAWWQHHSPNKLSTLTTRTTNRRSTQLPTTPTWMRSRTPTSQEKMLCGIKVLTRRLRMDPRTSWLSRCKALKIRHSFLVRRLTRLTNLSLRWNLTNPLTLSSLKNPIHLVTVQRTTLISRNHQQLSLPKNSTESKWSRRMKFWWRHRQMEKPSKSCSGTGSWTSLVMTVPNLYFRWKCHSSPNHTRSVEKLWWNLSLRIRPSRLRTRSKWWIRSRTTRSLRLNCLQTSQMSIRSTMSASHRFATSMSAYHQTWSNRRRKRCPRHSPRSQRIPASSAPPCSDLSLSASNTKTKKSARHHRGPHLWRVRRTMLLILTRLIWTLL